MTIRPRRLAKRALPHDATALTGGASWNH